MDILSVISTAVYYLSNFIYLIQGIFFYRLLCSIVKRRDGFIWTIVCIFSCAVLSSMIIFPNDLFNVTLDLIWFILMMLLAFKGSIWQKLAAVAILYPLVISQNFLVMDMLGNFSVLLGRPPVIEVLCSIADVSLHLSFWYVTYRFFEKRLFQMGKLFDNRTWILLDVICLASLVSITTCIYLSPEESYKMWPAAFACFATNLGSLFLAEYFALSIQRDMERKNLMLQKSYYEELEQNQQEIRRLRHDMNNYLNAVQSLFLNGNKEEAEQYLKDLESQIAVRNRVFCKNGIVNAVLNAKYNVILENNIDNFFHIDLQKLIGIDAVSLCCLFSNTLDNAIEASLKIPNPEQRRISVKARVTENGYFTYEITNAKVNAVSEQRGRFQTDKADSSSHGLGLSNVREMVEKYNGTLDISYTETTFRVTVFIDNA